MSQAPGWYVVNVADADTVSHEKAGLWVRLERPEQPFQEVGVNIRVLEPGQTSGMYHAESAEEHFLVLSGRCLGLIGGVEQELVAWDFVHVPPGVSHTFVGAGDGPCSILMMGGRHADKRTFYPASELAAKHDASSPVDTEVPTEAYDAWRGIGFEDVELAWPPKD
jgi:uncharacterized cupin superfamily protein